MGEVLFRIRFALAAGAVIAFGVCSSAAAADNGHGTIKGIVPSKTAHSTKNSPRNDLVYRGGSVLDDGNTVYAIFWSPGGKYSFSSGYESLIQRFYTDVGVATRAGATNDVYAVDNQYGPTSIGSTIGTPFTSNAETFGGSFVDNSPVTSGCRDRYTSFCVSDTQVTQEIQKDITAAGWSTGSNHMFFMFTAKGVGSCYSSSCSFTQWCAYHSNVGSMLYANMPYADTISAACDAGYHPNNNDADATINVASHEQNETITDPFGTAWLDNSGEEIGDKCAWTFGTVGSSQANQTINKDPYILQQEWSNNAGGCALQGS